MAFKPGDVVPESGIYNVTHDPRHAASHQVTCIEGDRFPPCRGCDHPRFILARGAVHVKEQRSFKKLRK
jgi:hypothetical protein